MVKVNQFDLFKGTGKEGVVVLAILETYDDGFLQVAECWQSDGEKYYAEYLKPASELAEDIVSGVVNPTGKSASSKSKIRQTMKP